MGQRGRRGASCPRWPRAMPSAVTRQPTAASPRSRAGLRSRRLHDDSEQLAIDSSQRLAPPATWAIPNGAWIGLIEEEANSCVRERQASSSSRIASTRAPLPAPRPSRALDSCLELGWSFQHSTDAGLASSARPASTLGALLHPPPGHFRPPECLFERHPAAVGDLHHPRGHHAIIAAIVDGRRTTAIWLIGSAWAALVTSLLIASQTAGWKQDDGLGRGFAVAFAAMLGLVYPAAVGFAFGLSHLLRRIRR